MAVFKFAVDLALGFIFDSAFYAVYHHKSPKGNRDSWWNTLLYGQPGAPLKKTALPSS